MARIPIQICFICNEQITPPAKIFKLLRGSVAKYGADQCYFIRHKSKKDNPSEKFFHFDCFREVAGDEYS